jgi:plastocyanin
VTYSVVGGVTKPTLIAGLLALTVFAAGCGGGYGGDQTATQPAAAKAAKAPKTAATVVELSSSTFQPAAIDVKAGETVTFVNRDRIAHTATATAGATFDSGTMAAGATFDFVAAKAGKISYVCNFHPGMTGTINVT